MDVRQFVSETLKQIIDGVSDSQQYAQTKGGFINEPFVT